MQTRETPRDWIVNHVLDLPLWSGKSIYTLRSDAGYWLVIKHNNSLPPFPSPFVADEIAVACWSGPTNTRHCGIVKFDYDDDRVN